MAKASTKTPDFYAVTLSKPFPIPGTTATVPAGESVVSADTVGLIPDEIIVAKAAAEA